VLSPVSGVCCHRHQRDTSHQLERHGRGARTTRLRRTLPRFRPEPKHLTQQASIATRTTLRDDRANVPHGGAGWKQDSSDLRNSQEFILDFRNDMGVTQAAALRAICATAQFWSTAKNSGQLWLRG
jgi:hypothetical protein